MCDINIEKGWGEKGYGGTSGKKTFDKNFFVKSSKTKKFGSSEEDEVSGFFVLSHLWIRGYFRLSKG